MGSGRPAARKPLRRRRQEEHRPQARSFVLVARPGEFEGRAQLKPQAHDPRFVQVDQGGVDGKVRFGRGPTR